MTSKKGREHPSAHTLGGKKTTHDLTRAQFHHIVSDASKSRQDGPRGVVVEIDDREDVLHGTAQICILTTNSGYADCTRLKKTGRTGLYDMVKLVSKTLDV